MARTRSATLQMIESPLNPAPSILGVPPITLTEDDDVAFSLSLCREVNRIYGAYAAGDLAVSENVLAGLRLTENMLLALATTVVDGMPGMRLEVATSQVREMNHVLFGISGAVGRAAFAPGELGRLLTAAEPSRPELPAAISGAGPAAPAPCPPRSDGGGRWRKPWERRGLVARVLIGLLGCLTAAVCVDIPFTAMALFPDLVLPLAVGFLAGPTLLYGLYRLHSVRRSPPMIRAS